MSRVLAGLMLLSVGLLVVSVLHDQLQRCITIDTLHLLQALQRANTAIGMLSCRSGVTNTMQLIDAKLCGASKLARWPAHAASWCCFTIWCRAVRAVRRVQ